MTVTDDKRLIEIAQKRAIDASRTAETLGKFLGFRIAALELAEAHEQGWTNEGGTDGRLLAQIDALQLQLQDIRHLVVRD